MQAEKFVVAFDVDGNLIDTEATAAFACYDILQQFFADDEQALQRVHKYLAPENGGTKWFAYNLTGQTGQLFCDVVNRFFSSCPNQMTMENFAVLHEKFGWLIADSVTEDFVLPDVVDMLDRLSADKNIAIYYISGAVGARLQAELVNSGIIRFADFDTNVYHFGMFPYKADAIKEIMAKEGVDNDHFIFSGDGATDMIQAKKVSGGGVYVIGNTAASHCTGAYADKLIQAGADEIVCGGKELYKAVTARINKIKNQK